MSISTDSTSIKNKKGLCDIRWNSKEAGTRWVKVKAMMWWTQVWRTIQRRRTQNQLLEHGDDVLKSVIMKVSRHCTINQQEDRVRLKEDDMQMTLQECCSKSVDERMTDNICTADGQAFENFITSRLHSTSSQGNKGATKVETSSKRPSDDCYDVLLICSGADTRRDIIGGLHQLMSRQGVKVFKHDEIGDQELAVENYKMSIIVFSRSFAFSTWRLDGLVKLLNKKKDIIPVYMGVSPDDLELKTNMYTDELARNEIKYSKEQVQEWRGAIKKVVRIKGWELKDNISFVDFIEEVAREVQMKLKVKEKYETQQFVELEHHTTEDDMPAQLEACESIKMDSSDFSHSDTPISVSIGHGVHENGNKPSVSPDSDLKLFGVPLSESQSSQKSTSLENVSRCPLSSLDPDDERMADNICLANGIASEDFVTQHSTSSEKNKGTAGEETWSQKRDVPSSLYDLLLPCRGLIHNMSNKKGLIRKGFSNILRQALRDINEGIKVLTDDNEVQDGDLDGEMLQAIEKAKICVPIFSKTFASGARCLRQVEMMVKMKKTIVPIFYDVIPDDVELKTIMYTDELAQHETRYGKDIVRGWSEALKVVAKMKGFQWKDNMSSVDLTEKLAGEVQWKLKLKEMSSEYFERHQLILNPSRQKFHRSSEMQNSTEWLDMNDLWNDYLTKINVFCANAFRQDSPPEDYEDVSGKIVSICKESPLALKLVGCLLHGQGKPYWESKIHEMQNIKELVDGMPELELFSRNAFELDSPPVEYQHLCNEVVSLCKGHPWILQMVGCLLHGHGRQFWENKIKMMRENADELVDLDAWAASERTCSNDRRANRFNYSFT